MKTPEKLLILFFNIFLSLSGFSQNDIQFKVRNFPNDKENFEQALLLLKKGDKFYNKADYAQALPLYIEANGFNSENSVLNSKIAMCFFYTSEPDKAIPYFEKYEKLQVKPDAEIIFFQAQAYHLENYFENAEKYYEIAANKFSKFEKKQKFSAEHKKKQANSGLYLFNNPRDTQIKNIGNTVNTASSEYSPAFSEQVEDIYVISGTNAYETQNESLKSKTKKNEIYYFPKFENNTDKPKKTDIQFNSSEYETSISFSHNGKFRLICNYENTSDIFISELERNTWSVPQALPEQINSKYIESSAVITNDGNTIYFTSNRNKKSGFDIFVCRKDESGNWQQPQNIGNSINTDFDEISVSLHPDANTLYFSSNCEKSMGGFDIYKIQKNIDSLWSEPQNLGFPVNTSFDEIYFTVPDSGMFAYLASNKKGGYGGYDIYSVALNDDIAYMTLLKGSIYEIDTKKPVVAMITVFDSGQNFIGTGITEMDGSYELALPAGTDHLIYVDAPDYLFYSDKFTVEEVKSFTVIEKDISLVPNLEGAKVTMGAVTFDFNTSTINPSSFSTLDQVADFMKKNETLKIEISGHTDNIGSKAGNLKISKERADAVATYLIGKGIPKDRISSSGYGYDQPISDNNTEEGRQKNRRVEFKIIEK